MTIISETGRICNEFKFSVNKNLELEGKKIGKSTLIPKVSQQKQILSLINNK